MINIRNLIDFLPFFFKHKDTYKNDEGKGILERFLEICGDYFTDNIKSVIDNSLEVINIETTSSQYLAWLWELLGQIPFANSSNSLHLNLTERQQRDLIKYCNELLKIRGSKEFFEIMFRLYSNGVNNLQLVSITSESHGWESDIRGIRYEYDDPTVLWPYFDVDNFDDHTIAFDEYYKMKQCIEVTFDITGTFSSDHDDSAKKAIRAFIEKYVPYNVNPIIKVNGEVITDTYDLVLEVLDNGVWKPKTSITLRQGHILKVRVYAKNTSDQIVEGIGITSNLNGGDVVTRTSIYEFEISNVVKAVDEYSFTLEGRSTTSVGKTKTLKVIEKADDKMTYNISINKKSEQLTDENREGTCIVTAYYTVNGGEQKFPSSVMCLETGEVKTSENGKVTTDWKFTIPGKYTFLMIGHTSSQVTYELKEFGVNYTVTLCKAIKVKDSSGNEKWVEAAEGYDERITISGTQYNQLKFFVKVTSNDSKISKDKLKCFILGNPYKHYSSGELVTAPGFDTYTFVPVNAKAGDGSTNAILETLNESLVFHTHLFDREKDSNGVDYPFEINNTKSSIWAEFQATPVSNQARYEVAKGLVMVVELPDGKTTIEVNPGKTITPEGFDCTLVGTGTQSGGIYTINNVKITSKQGGVYKIWPKIYPHSKAIWEVTDNRVSEELPEGIMIVPNKGSSGWTGENTSNATCQLSPDNTEATFSLVCYRLDSESGNKYAVDVPLAMVTASNGKSYTLGTYYTETEVQDITFTVNTKYSDNSNYKQATLRIRDFVTGVKIKCTPVSALLNNGQAVTNIYISSNREGVDLKARLQGTEDLYENGDTFLANEAKKYTFVAMLNGKPAVDQEGNQITCTFTVVDPFQIGVTPVELVFEADGSPSSTGDTIQITTGDNTDWILIIQ